MDPESYLATLTAPFEVPADLTAFRAQFTNLRDDSARFWVLYLVLCPAAAAQATTIRAIVHRLFFANRITQGAAADALRAQKLDAIIDHFQANPTCLGALTDLSQCWTRAAEWWAVAYPSDDVRYIEL